jgi:hypothetical protein
VDGHHWGRGCRADHIVLPAPGRPHLADPLRRRLFLWLIYGIAADARPLIAANGITLTLVLIIAFVKARGSA